MIWCRLGFHVPSSSLFSLLYTSLRSWITLTGSKFSFKNTCQVVFLPSLHFDLQPAAIFFFLWKFIWAKLTTYAREQDLKCSLARCYFRHKRWVTEIYTSTLPPAQSNPGDSACGVTQIKNSSLSSRHAFCIKFCTTNYPTIYFISTL